MHAYSEGGTGMRRLIAIPFIGSLALLVAGAAAPNQFVLALLGMALLAGCGGLSMASLHRPGPRVRP
jgi:hypothetical protein